jgi:hypothetical protein
MPGVVRLLQCRIVVKPFRTIGRSKENLEDAVLGLHQEHATEGPEMANLIGIVSPVELIDHSEGTEHLIRLLKKQEPVEGVLDTLEAGSDHRLDVVAPSREEARLLGIG